jgi:hypothetical protein
MGPINIFLSRTHLHETALLKQLLTASGVPSTRVNKIYHARSEMKNKCTYVLSILFLVLYFVPITIKLIYSGLRTLTSTVTNFNKVCICIIG